MSPTPIHQDVPVSSEAIPESIKLFDDTAKQLITVEGLLVGLYFNAFTFGKVSSGWGWQLIVYLAPVAFLFASLLAALRVFFPSGYLSFTQQSAGPHQVTYAQLVHHKRVWFSVASTFFVLGIAGFFFALMTYLLR